MTSVVQENCFSDSLEKKFFDLVVHPVVRVEAKSTAANPVKHGRKLERRRPFDRQERRRLLVGNKKPGKKESANNMPLVDPGKQLSPLELLVTSNPSATVLQCRILQEVKDAEQKSLALKKISKTLLNADACLSEDKLPDEFLSIPQVMELGLLGVFEVIRSTATRDGQLCCQALRSLLNMLQELKLQEMQDEPPQVLENLFQLLLDLSRLPAKALQLDDEATKEKNMPWPFSDAAPCTKTLSSIIPSIACSCLLSLVLAWGNTGKILSVIAAFVADCSNQEESLVVVVPPPFIALQKTVQAAILSKHHIPTPIELGINESSLFQSWKMEEKYTGLSLVSIQSDGSYLFCVFTNSLLLKVGSGYGSTVEGHIYGRTVIADFQSSSKSDQIEPKALFYFKGFLYVLATNKSFYLIDKSDFSVEHIGDAPPDEDIWFCDGVGLCCVVPLLNEDSHLIKCYDFGGDTLVLNNSIKVHPTKRHFLTRGKTLGYNPVKEPVAEKEHFEVVQVLLAADFSLCTTNKGQVYFAGKAEALGLNKTKSRKVTSPELLPIPTQSKINHIAVASDGDHAILITESGSVYFTGTAHRGEDGESSKGRRQQAQKPKLMKCMEGKHVLSGCCNSGGTSALVTKDGRLYLFGKDSSQADSKTGLVAALSDTQVKQVALGKAHVVVISNDGRLWTAGVNNRGQCGRQEGVMSITQRIAEVEQEKDVSMPDDKSMDDILASGLSGDAPIAPICSPDKHEFRRQICEICAVCCECTGYGSSCVYSSVEGRSPRNPCGCGAGWSGCSECGCCRTCAGEANVNPNEERKEEMRVGPGNGLYQPLNGRSPPSLSKLANLFHAQAHAQKRVTGSGSRDNKVPSKSDILKEANKMALLPLMQVRLPKEGDGSRKACQIACGDHHTVVLTDVGSVCVFGKNNHGQLGLGDTHNRNQPTRINLPHKVVKISAGSHHSILLTDDGLLFGCGSNAQGQLGPISNVDVLVPTLILPFQQVGSNVPRVSWVSATQTSTFIRYEEVLLNVTQLDQAKIFGTPEFFGISYQPDLPEDTNQKSHLLLIDRSSSHCQHYHQENVRLGANEQTCIDQANEVLWSFNASDWTVKSYLLCGYKNEAANQNLPFQPQLAIPMSLDLETTRTQAGLNLLSCINTLVTRCPNGLHFESKGEKSNAESSSSTSKATGKVSEPHTVDEYNIVSRFKSHGGGWGYSVHSTEAIRFMTDTDILLGGVGVFGGRGEYSVTVSVYEEVGDADVQGEGELLVETDQVPYECGFRERFHALFDEPVSIASNQWYTITCKVVGPSSDCGSHGEQNVTTSDNIKFTFRRSKWSNNGTDVSAGQIPELLYSLPVATPPSESEISMKPVHQAVVQKVSKSFYLSFNESAFESLPYILEWARTLFFTEVSKKSSRYDDPDFEVIPFEERQVSRTIENLSFIIPVCLRLLRVAINQCMAKSGGEALVYSYINQCVGLVDAILTDGEIDAALEDALLMPDFERSLVMSSAIAMITECHMIVTECIEAFHPSPPTKWAYLHRTLDNYNTAARVNKARMARLLTAVLDSFCQNSVDLVQCLPLFPRTLSNLASVMSPSADDAISTDASVANAGFYDVAYSLVEIACHPARVAVKIEKEYAVEKDHKSDIQQSKFSRMLFTPQKSIVSSACKLLSSLASDLAYRASDVSSHMKNIPLQKNFSSAMRFDGTDNNRSWNSGNGSPDATCFSVDLDDVYVGGFGVYGGGKLEHKYELEFLEQASASCDSKKGHWDTRDCVKGSYALKDCGPDHIVNIKLTKSFLLKKNVTYAVCLRNHGDRTYCGERGRATVVCNDGVTFHFTHCDQSTNGTSISRGQIPSILYHRSNQDEEFLASPIDKWVGTATTPVTAGLAYQRHALNILALVTESAVEILNSLTPDDLAEVKGEGSQESEEVQAEKTKEKEGAREVLTSELISHLLPGLFSNIGVLVRHNPHCAVEVMELIRNLLPPLINVQQILSPPFKNDLPLHSVVVESSHPYKPAQVSHYKASFPSSVKWMLIEFSSKCQTAQVEDSLRLFLSKTGNQAERRVDEKGRDILIPVLKKMSQDKNWPQNATVLPGHELFFQLHTASDYTNNKDKKPHLFYGFKCTVTGYEKVPLPKQQDGSFLVNELINVAGLASNTLMKVHEQLWNEDKDDLDSSNYNQNDKVDHLRAIETTAAVTLERHSSLFLPGLHLNFFPGSSQALNGTLPFTEGSKEKLFLYDFISAAPDTTGGRLARWLQPDSFVDPKQCLLHLNVKSLVHTLPASVTIITRDQYGKPVHVPTMKVELVAKPQPSSHLNNETGVSLDISPTDPSPVFEAKFEVTKHRDSRYQTITMMRPYKKYSFEELRLAYPHKQTFKSQNILVASVGGGTYRATWIPALAATYTLQVTLDQQLRGPRQLVVVSPAPLGCSEHPRNSPVSTLTELTSKLLRFATRNSRGLRIRSHPTLQSPQIGLLEYDDIIECCQEVHNNDGDWVKLSKTSIEKYCKENTNEAWCISFHKHNSRTFLLPVDAETSRAKENDKKHQPKPVLESVTQLIPPIPPLRTSGKPSTSNIIPPPQATFSLEENPFTSASTPGHSKIFSSPFATPTQTVAKEWVEKVPGEYTVKKCGSSGHNIRYNPSKKAAPLGKLVFGNTFMAAGIKRNTSGIWLLLHRAEVSQFCEESPDEGHAWALAVSVDGTQHLSSVEGPSVSLPLLSGQKEKSKMLQEMVTPTSSTNANNLAGKDSMLASAIRGAAFAKLTNPFQDSSSGGSESEVVDLLVASLPGMIPDANLPAPKAMDVAKTPKKQDWKARVKRHHRSSSDSDAMMPRSKANSLKYEAGRGRVHRSLSQRSPPSRSHSIPNSKPRSSSRVVSSSRVKAPPRKTLVERQSLQHPAKYPGTRKKTPSEKILCGGKKKEVKDDIPFIDDVIDAEGNILSSGKSDEDKKGPGKDEEEQTSGTRLSDLVNQIKMTPPTRRQPPLTKLFSQQKTPGKVSDQMKSKKSQSSSQALSPLVAECARAVFAAFLWHEGIVHDAMACASFLKFNLTARSQVMKFTSLGTSSSDDMKFPRRRASEQSADEKDVPRAKLDSSGSSHPPDTLLYLAMFWDQLSDMVTKIAIRNQNLPLPTPVNQNLNCHSEKPVPPAKNLKLPDPEPGLDRAMAGNIDLEYIRLHPLKRKPFQRNNAFPPQLIGPQARRNLQPHAAPYYHQAPVQGNIVGADPGDHFKDTRCDLCDKVHPFPITYHMKQAHPGCGKFAGGVGYNSSGNYCGGWAGDCGDGGVGGSTWYLLCLTCRHKYMSMKSVVLSSEKQDKKSNGSWMTRLHALLTQPTNAHQVMKDNAMFLLNLKSASSGTPQLYEQQNEWNKGSATFFEKETDMVAESSKIDDEGIWEKTVSAVDLLPQSKYTHCPFPAIPCSYLAMHGKENGINNNIRPNQLGKMKGMQDYQNRSLSNPPSSGQLRHVSQRLSITPDSSPHKTEMAMYQRNSRLMRSVSTGSQPQRRRTCSGGDASPMGISTGSFLLHNPSAAMKKLMCGQSGNSNDIARDAVQCSYVLPFVTQRHDLKSLHLTMQMTLRRAALRVYVLQALTWLLRTVVSESAIHDILWYFVAALTETAADSHKKDAQKSVDGDVTDDDMEETKSLYVHPVKDIANAGIDSMQPLVEAFHGFLQTVSDIMMDLPPNSPVQLMAIRCWSLRVLPSDHQFLHQSKVFSHISQILSKVDSKAPSEKKVKLRVNQKSQKYVPVAEASRHSGKVYRLRDLSLKVQIKTSSHTSIANSLTDGSTETFWESGDEDKNKSKNITIDFAEKKDDFSKIFVHIDNTRDVQKKVTSVAYWVESNEEWNRSNLCDINTHFVGWLAYNIPEKASKVKMELRGPDNGLRVRQVKILGDSAEAGEDFVEQLPANMLRAQTCESELLKVFKLLTAEVFGRLLSDQSSSSSEPSTPVSNKVEDKVENNGNTSVPPSPREVDPNLREHMVGILFSRSKLTSLQKKVFDHTVQAIHTEAARIKLTWQANLEKSAANLQLRTEENDVYCFELLSMLLALSGSDVGCHYVAQQNPLINDFISLLHTGTPRIQRQVTLLLRRILSEVTPNQLASILSTNIPCQDKLSNTATETPPQTSTSSTFDISVLDPLFACIAKSLSVQVKGTPEPAPITGEGDASATIKLKRHQTITLQSQFNDRPELDHPAWWMHGSIQDRSIVEAIIRLLSDMSAGKISTVWEIVTKCSVSEAILSLMKLTEAEREAGCCLRNRITWQALAALCVLDHDHVEKLSSARSSSQKNKLTCDNHDDGSTPAIVLCNECGNLCSECDRYLHLHKRTLSHQRQVFKEEEEAIRVNLHEGCGRIKLFWFMALADANTLKAIVEFKSRAPGGQRKHVTTGTGVCRFCGRSSDDGQLAVGNVCSDPACQQHAARACTRTHQCGHLCGGVKDEESCLPCLQPSCNPALNQDADDMCMVCFTDALAAAPAVQLDCGHIFHYSCCEMQLQKQWAGPRITFSFMHCSICKCEIKHPSLDCYLAPLRDLVREVERKALQRLEYEGLNECESITAIGGRFFNDRAGFALSKYAYYMCCKCKKAYYGGEVRCDAEAGGADLFDPQELICGACSDVSCAQICPKHGTDFLEYKCRYCCSVAVYFCFGTTHFCQPCHDDFQRITALPKSDLPHCPAGHKTRQLEGEECPLHVVHPPTGEEFALGCGVCRNAHTF
ncbi:E3 ubiquitin-protein ligase MYCBP2-like isoform X2 [Clavelina lepadiformis]|uniref:E3 ubiquitin-protein ligase MYCBP2-like isoform X2 n=1 Tax=Clavelina lepadiformis TaxID=159417 RepID=UPI0040420BEA